MVAELWNSRRNFFWKFIAVFPKFGKKKKLRKKNRFRSKEFRFCVPNFFLDCVQCKDKFRHWKITFYGFGFEWWNIPKSRSSRAQNFELKPQTKARPSRLDQAFLVFLKYSKTADCNTNYITLFITREALQLSGKVRENRWK